MKQIIDDKELTVQSLDLKPGDVIVLTHPQALSDRAMANISDIVKDKFPGIEVLVLCEDMTIEVVRNTDKIDTRCKGEYKERITTEETTFEKE